MSTVVYFCLLNMNQPNQYMPTRSIVLTRTAGDFTVVLFANGACESYGVAVQGLDGEQIIETAEPLHTEAYSAYQRIIGWCIDTTQGIQQIMDEFDSDNQ